MMVKHAPKTLHLLKRFNNQSPDGRYAKAYGMRVGYWPCVGGPFVQFSFGARVVSIWYGIKGQAPK